MVAKAHDNDYVNAITCIDPVLGTLLNPPRSKGWQGGGRVRYVNGIKGVLVFGNENAFVHVSNSVFE